METMDAFVRLRQTWISLLQPPSTPIRLDWRLLETKSWKNLAIGPEGNCNSVAWSPDGQRLLVDGYKMLRVLESSEAQELLSIPVSAITRQCSWTADGQGIIALVGDELLYWDACRGFELKDIVYQSMRHRRTPFPSYAPAAKPKDK